MFRRNKRNVLAFEIVATGIGDIYYLWQRFGSYSDNWIPVSSRAVNDTSATLNFKVITEEDQGIYHCIVTNYDGSVTSDNVTITVYGKLLATKNCSYKDLFWKAKLNPFNYIFIMA